MDATYLILWVVGLGIIWLGLRTKDEDSRVWGFPPLSDLSGEAYRLGAGVAAAIFLVWGFAWTPSQLQFFMEAIALIAVFPTCIRCLKE